VWDLRAELGEGPVWDERDQALWFTDIKRQKIHRYDPATGARRSWDSPEQAGFVLPAQSGGFAVGLQSGLYRFVPETNEFHGLVAVEPELPGNRINDGTVDPSGRLWFGTMDNGEREKSGAFYCFDGGVLKRTNVAGISITNGPAISPDGRTLYWIDTLGGTMSACEIGDDGELGPSRLVVRIPPTEGHPDGPTVDSEGCIWVGLYGGWEARRYSPEGELLTAVSVTAASHAKDGFAAVTIGADGTCIANAAASLNSDVPRIALGCVDAVPVLLQPESADEEAVRSAVREAGLEPPSDVHASADYRRHLAEICAVRAVAQAQERGGA